MPHKDLGRDDRFEPRQAEHEHFIFEGVEFPTTKEELVAIATDGEVDPDRLNLIRALPDREYVSRDDVWRAIGEASRRFGVGMRNIGTPRDDIGKQATVDADGHVNRP